MFPLAVAAITVLLYWPSLSGAFLNWDDELNFVKNEAYRGLGADNLRWMFTSYHLGPYQPLSWITLAIDYLVWGMDPYGYHLTSVLFHAVNAGLMFVLARRLLRMTGGAVADPARAMIAAALAALFFAVHPLRVESVAWITERRDVVSGFFVLLTLIAYLNLVQARQKNQPAGRWFAAALALYVLSLLSKASPMTLPIALLVMDVWLFRRELKAAAIEKIPFLIPAAIVAVIALKGQRTVESLSLANAEGALPRVARVSYSLLFYVWKSIVPTDLSPLYEVPFRGNPADARFIGAAVGVAAITIAAWLLRRRWPAVFVAWAAYIILMLPVSGFAHPGGQILADRFTYIPGFAFALLSAAGVRYVFHRFRGSGDRFRLGPLPPKPVPGTPKSVENVPDPIFAAAIIVLGIMTARQIPVWHDSVALWTQAWRVHPLEARRAAGASVSDIRALEAEYATLRELSAHRVIALQYADALSAAGRLPEAADVLAHGAAASPANADIHNTWAGALIALGRYEQAGAALEKAIALDPADADAFYNLGLVRSAQGRADQAITAYQRSIALNKDSAPAHYNLGVLLAQAQKLREAEAEYQRAIALKPNYPEAFNNLGVALGRQGRTDEAITAFTQAVTLDPRNESAQQNLSRARAVRATGR